MIWRLEFSAQARKDARRIREAGLQPQVQRLLDILQANPYQSPPHYEKLMGTLQGCCSRRINRQHRLVYEIEEERGVVHLIRMWTHYGD